MKQKKKKPWVIAFLVCLTFCACQTPKEDTGELTTPAPTESVGQESTPTIAPTEAVEPTEEPTSAPEISLTPAIPETFSETISSARVVVDGIVHTCDICVADDKWYISAEDAESIFGVISETKYMSLDSYAKETDISYEQDTVLNAAYVSTWEPYEKVESSFDFERAFILGLVPEEFKERASEQITSTEFRSLLADLIAKLAPDKMPQFDENVTKHETAMSREQGFVMAFYAAECIGANNFNNDFDHSRADGGDFWDCDWNDYTPLYPHVFEGPYYCGNEGTPESAWTDWGDVNTAAHLWSFWHSSPVSGNLMFTFDEEAGSMHKKDALTVQEAVSVVTRLYDSVGGMEFVSVSEAVVTEGFSQNLTPELRKKLGEAPEITAENHPVWTGLIFGYAYYRQLNDNTEELRMCANFGFNSARLLLDYEPFFNSDVTEVNLTNLQTLDRMVETAIQYNLHLNICFATVPGRTAYSNPVDFTSEGSFDLFVNEEKQEQANRMWAALAKRYAEVPSAYLSFTPFWEAANYNLSTGLPAQEYSAKDIGNYLAEVVDVIRGQDAERLVIYEPTANNGYGDIMEVGSVVKDCVKDMDNIIISYNFCETPYVYANMTATEGEHIDNNNHSMFLPQYPNYIYSVGFNMNEEYPVTFTGCLPAGTVLDIYVKKSWGTTVSITADGETLLTEELERNDFETSELVSGYYPYSTSEKKISVTLKKAVEKLVVSCTNDGLELAGMDVYLPEEYAVERWYTATTYDVYMGYEEEAGVKKKATNRIMIAPNDYNYLTNIEILEDVSFKTGKVWAEASKDTITQWGEHISEFDKNCVIRYEGACFNGAVWEYMYAYYRDLLDMFVENGFSWWSGDWHWMTYDHTKNIGGYPSIEYANYPYFNIELLKLLQEHQNSERTTADVESSEPLVTPIPTEKPQPDETPIPTATATPVPTSKPMETPTPIPTSTPTPTPKKAQVLTEELDMQLHGQLQSRIDEILNSETEIYQSDTFVQGETYTGKVYYVSNDGDDANDGLTPETAWRTVQKVSMEASGWGNDGVLQYGDAVLFRRGDIFRIYQEFEIVTSGLTFSTYGEGEKPILTASSENGTGAEKWELAYEDESGMKVWKFYQDVLDVAEVVINNGEIVTSRVYEFYDGTEYLSCTDYDGWHMHEECGVTLLGGTLPFNESMTEDLSIISRPVRYAPEVNYMDCGVGPLYLRCDAGNPGELYESIEFSEYAKGVYVSSADEITFDNISFRYNGTAFMKAFDWKVVESTLIQNCEFAYCGGSVTDYSIRENGALVVGVQGDGIYTVVKDTVIKDCYFHDLTSTTGTYESSLADTEPESGTYTFIDNVCVNTMGVRLDSTAISLYYLDKVTVSGNYIWNTGQADVGKFYYSEGSIIVMMNRYGECIVEDNILYGTIEGHPMNALLCLYFYDYPSEWGNEDLSDCTKPIFGNNIYAQYEGRNWGDFLNNGAAWGIEDPDLLDKVEKYFGDTTSQYYVIPAK